jgi:hypothetical protein
MPACYDLPAAFAQYPLRGGPNDVAKRLSSSGTKACGLTRSESKVTACPDKYLGVDRHFHSLSNSPAQPAAAIRLRLWP